MIEFRPFRSGHLTFLTPQDAQRDEWSTVVASGGAAALEGAMSMSAWDGARCVGAAGLIHVTPYRAAAWMLLSAQAGAYMLPVVRKVRRVIQASPYKRVELTVAVGFVEGHRFARLVGAERETPKPMRYFGHNGGDEIMYAVVKGE